jgi:hydrogenase maturation protease
MSILVLGIGNPIRSDDGVGVRVVKQLAAAHRFSADVALMEGGTLGLALLPYLAGVMRLVLVDAVDTGRMPGVLVRLEGNQISQTLESQFSPHQMGLKDLLAVAGVLGTAPEEVVLWGVQPENLGLGLEMSATVAARVESLAGHVVAELERWGAGPLETMPSAKPQAAEDG